MAAPGGVIPARRMIPAHRLLRRSNTALVALTLSLAGAACSDRGAPEGATGDDDLTSNSGSQRSLTFQGLFYVPTGTSLASIQAQAALQAKALFGALRTSDIMVASRYMT